MPRDIRDRRGRVLTSEQRKVLRKRAKALKKRQRRKATKGEIAQIITVIFIILGIIYFAFHFAA